MLIGDVSNVLYVAMTLDVLPEIKNRTHLSRRFHMHLLLPCYTAVEYYVYAITIVVSHLMYSDAPTRWWNCYIVLNAPSRQLYYRMQMIC